MSEQFTGVEDMGLEEYEEGTAAIWGLQRAIREFESMHNPCVGCAIEADEEPPTSDELQRYWRTVEELQRLCQRRGWDYWSI